LTKGVFITIGDSYSEIWKVKAVADDIHIEKTAADRDRENELKSELKTWPRVLFS